MICPSASLSALSKATLTRLTPRYARIPLFCCALALLLQVPHGHMDTGWEKTVDQYFYGANNSIQHAGVQYIFDSVVSELARNPERRFVEVEQAFFQRWWAQQGEEQRALVRRLVSEGQLEFLNGGWCMHDEAAPHFADMVDQTTLGHRFLMSEFGVAPTIGWQIDPFGHSATQAWLLSAEAGFDALFFGRMDYEDHALRWNESRLEHVWRASQSLGASAQVFTSAYWSGNYGPPEGFCFDDKCDDPPIMDDPRLEDYNVPERVELFVQTVLDLAAHTPGNDLLLMMGSDFHYENAIPWFKNLDKLIKHVNADGRVNTFYSTPSAYVAAKHASDLTWTVKTDDYFPYSECRNCYWTGYFTSRPALKGYVRTCSALYQAARQLAFASGQCPRKLDAFADALAVAQHHDAVSGTSKQHVAFDYAARLSRGQADAEGVIASALAGMAGVEAKLTMCRALNESVCAATQGADEVRIVAYNSLPRARTETVRVPVDSEDYEVVTAMGENVRTQVVPSGDAQNGRAPFLAVFQAQLPALGFTTFTLRRTARPAAPAAPAARVDAADFARAFGDAFSMFAGEPAARRASEDVALENEFLKLTFDSDTGLLASVTNKETGVTVAVAQDFAYYRSFAEGGQWPEGQNSGAYIFRPASNDAVPVARSASVHVRALAGRGPALR